MYEVGKKYKFRFVGVYTAKDGNNYLHLEDPKIPDSFISVKPYSFQTDWYDTTEWLECYCKRQDVYGRFQFELSRDALLDYLYGPNLGHYQYFTIDKRVKDKNGVECFRITDPYGFSQFFYPGAKHIDEYKVGDEIILDVVEIIYSPEGMNNARLELKPKKDNSLQMQSDRDVVVIRDDKAFSIGEEDMHNEFKSSIAFPAGGNEENMEQQLAVLMHSIAGFMNKEGGTLYIGVNDSGEPYKDINEEFQYLNDDSKDTCTYKANADQYKLKLINKIHKDLGGYAVSLVNIRFEKANNVTYAAIDAQKADSVVWYQNRDLYVRCGNSTRRMLGDSITKFILTRTNERKFDEIVNKPEVDMQEEEVLVQTKDNNEPIAISRPLPISPKGDIWRYISLYKNGQWMFTKQSVGLQNDMITEVPIPKEPKKQVIMIAYASGKVNAVELKTLLYGTGRNQNTLIPTDVRRNYGISEGHDSIINAFCMKKGGLLLVQSTVDGQVKVKAHKMEAITTHSRLDAQGNMIIPEGTLTHIAPVDADSVEKSSIEAMGIVVKDYDRYHKNGVDKGKLQGKYQELIDKILTILPQNS